MTHTPETRVEPPAPAANEKAQRSLTKTIFRNSMVVTLGGGIVRLLDACFHVIGAVMPAEQRDDPDAPIYVPVGMSGVQVFQPAPAAVWCHIQLSPESVPGAPALMCSVQLLNEAGEGVAVIERLDLMQAPRTQWGNDNKTNGWFHQIAWRAQPRTADAATIEPGAWLIIADEAETGAALAETLRARGNTCTLAIPGSNTAQHEPNLWQFDANDPHAIRTLRDAMGPEPIRGVVGMWTSTAEPDSLEALWANQRLATSTVLQLAQTLAEAGGAAPRLWLVTRGAQPAEGDGSPVVATQASLWGLGRVIARESPALHCTRIDLDVADAPTEMTQLADELLSSDRE